MKQMKLITGAVLSITIAMNSRAELPQIASGAHHGLALTKNGTLWAWGYNSAGQLGACFSKEK